MPLIPLIIIGIGVTGWAAKETGDALDSATNLSRWLVIGGCAYMIYDYQRRSKS